MRVGFVGAGNMAAAIARGWAASPDGPSELLFADPDAERVSRLADEVGGKVAPDNRTLAASVDLVVLAVKPAMLEAAAAEMDSTAPALLSILAATPIAEVEALFPGVPVIRVIPNQPVEARRGVLCYTVGDAVPDALERDVLGLLSLLGSAVPLADGLINAATAVMSCAPAYVAMFAKALSDAGTANGLSEGDSLELVRETLAGTAALLETRDAEAIQRAVATPGGISQAGLDVLAEAGMPEAVRRAVDLTVERMGA